jgi:hypothetical protein
VVLSEGRIVVIRVLLIVLFVLVFIAVPVVAYLRVAVGQRPETGTVTDEHGILGHRVHRTPRCGESVAPCCGILIFDLPMEDHFTSDPSLVTCAGARVRLD